MTREELLKAAQKFYAIHKDCIINDVPVKKYLEIGLKALEREPCADTISRQAAIDLAKDICVPTEDGNTYRHRCIDPDEIREMPSAQQENKYCPKCGCRMVWPQEKE